MFYLTLSIFFIFSSNWKDDEMFGDFEDLESGEKFAGDESDSENEVENSNSVDPEKEEEEDEKTKADFILRQPKFAREIAA